MIELGENGEYGAMEERIERSMIQEVKSMWQRQDILL